MQSAERNWQKSVSGPAAMVKGTCEDFGNRTIWG